MSYGKLNDGRKVHGVRYFCRQVCLSTDCIAQSYRIDDDDDDNDGEGSLRAAGTTTNDKTK